MSIKNYIIGGFLVVFSNTLLAQNTMRIHFKDRAEQDISISQIDSVTFVYKEQLEEDVSLIGCWLWGNKEAGYYELITFDEDYTYKGYDNYFTYSFDTQTYGWYLWHGNMLTLQSNGMGYRRIYNWYIIGLSNNALEVMTKTGSYIYYKLQPKVLYVSLSEPYFDLANEEAVIFADGVFLSANGNKLHGLLKGTTYILVMSNIDNQISAYRVIIK